MRELADDVADALVQEGEALLVVLVRGQFHGTDIDDTCFMVQECSIGTDCLDSQVALAEEVSEREIAALLRFRVSDRALAVQSGLNKVAFSGVLIPSRVQKLRLAAAVDQKTI